jgi:hypothetical protein
MPEKPTIHPQRDLFSRGYEELSPEQQEANAIAHEAMMAERQARYEEEAKERKRWEGEADYPFEVEVLVFDPETGAPIPSPEHREWLERQERCRAILRDYEPPQQLTIDLRPKQSPEGSRDQG